MGISTPSREKVEVAIIPLRRMLVCISTSEIRYSAPFTAPMPSAGPLASPVGKLVPRRETAAMVRLSR